MTLLSAGPVCAGGVKASKLLPELAGAAASPSAACLRAIKAAESSFAIPPGFLLAIGRVESGRPEEKTGLVQPWPWTIDIDAKGSFFDTKSEGIAFVENAREQGIQSIDVGCMQVNLLQHPTAFASLDDAFDPVINATYAARFLVALEHEAGDWVTAAGLYHSRTEALAAPYRDLVVARFGGAPFHPAPPPPSPVAMLAAAWSATLPTGGGGSQGSLHLFPKPQPATVRTASGHAVRLTAR